MAKKRKNRTDKRNKSVFASQLIDIIRGVLSGTAFTLISILVMALLIKSFDIPASIIKIANTTVKIAAVVIAVISASKHDIKPLLIKNMICGVAFITVGYLVMSIIVGSFGRAAVLISDIGMSAVSAAIMTLILSVSRSKKA